MDQQAHRRQHAAMAELIKQQKIINDALREHQAALRTQVRALRDIVQKLAEHQGFELDFDDLDDEQPPEIEFPPGSQN